MKLICTTVHTPLTVTNANCMKNEVKNNIPQSLNTVQAEDQNFPFFSSFCLVQTK